MPTKPPKTFRPSWAGAPRKPFASTGNTKRLRGRANQERRERIAGRDRFTCCVCGRVVGLQDGEVDHVIPLCRNGTEDDTNLAWICRTPCHEDKSLRERGQRPKRQIGPDGYPVE